MRLDWSDAKVMWDVRYELRNGSKSLRHFLKLEARVLKLRYLAENATIFHKLKPDALAKGSAEWVTNVALVSGRMFAGL